jgi:hypothetical protein
VATLAWAEETITGEDIVNGSIQTEDLANLSVTTRKLAAQAVTAAKLANRAVTEAKLAPALRNRLNLLEAATLKVVDADDKEIGPIFSTFLVPIIPVIAFHVDERVVPLIVVSRNNFFGFLPLLYQSANCTGQAFLPDNPEVLFPVAAIAPPGQTVYVPDQTVAPQALTIRSAKNADGSCGTPPNDFPNELVPAVRTVNLNRLFKRPYSVR